MCCWWQRLTGNLVTESQMTNAIAKFQKKNGKLQPSAHRPKGKMDYEHFLSSSPFEVAAGTSTCTTTTTTIASAVQSSTSTVVSPLSSSAETRLIPKLAEAGKQLKAARRKLEDQEQEISNLKFKQAALIEVTKDCTFQLHMVTGENKELLKSLNEMKRKIEELENVLEEKNTEIVTLQKRLNQYTKKGMEKKLQRREEEVIALKHQNHVTAEHSKETRYKTEIRTLQLKNADSNHQLKKMKVKIQKMEENLKILRGWREQRWYSEEFPKPPYRQNAALDKDNLDRFKDIIWNRPARVQLNEFGSSAEEMAVLCGVGGEEWLLSSHMEWLVKQANRQYSPTLSLCMGVTSPNYFRQLVDRHPVPVERLVVIANVGREPVQGRPQYKTYISGATRSGGCHWVLMTVDLTDKPSILYCDTLGWEVPDDLQDKLAEYTAAFGIGSLAECSITSMNPSSNVGYQHTCSARCKNYPLQHCSDVCGVIAGVCAVIAAMDHQFFQLLVGPKKENDGLFLKHPSLYERYLRRVMISWFITDSLNLKESRSSVEAEFCTLCLKKDDDAGNTIMDWIECSFCKAWIHEHCDLQDVKGQGDYKCPTCRKSKDLKHFQV